SAIMPLPHPAHRSIGRAATRRAVTARAIMRPPAYPSPRAGARAAIGRLESLCPRAGLGILAHATEGADCEPTAIARSRGARGDPRRLWRTAPPVGPERAPVQAAARLPPARRRRI